MKQHVIAVVASVILFPLIALAQPFDPVPAVDLAKLKPADFSDEELDLPGGGNNSNFPMPYLLANFKVVADAVSDGTDGQPRGFITKTVWRGTKDNKPYNARIMENHLSLAYFYVTERPWNVYRGNTGVKQRLEAALDFLASIQSPEGKWSEYGEGKYNLAATAFATKFLGETLRLLKNPDAPPIDDAVMKRIVAADRKAILCVFTDPDFYNHGKRFTNQYGNVWPGALAYVALFPEDTEVAAKLKEKFLSTTKDFRSPAGFFYENDGPDWSYNLNTHASNQRMARHYTRGTELGKGFVEDEGVFVEWLSYNAVPAPDGSGFVLNKPVETRGNVGFTRLIESGYGDEVEMTRAFAPTDEEVAQRKAASRANAEQDWPKVPKIGIGEFRAYAPYNFLHREHKPVHPTREQRDAARAKLPYFADTSFNHQRVDDRRDPAPVYTYVRRPTYYAAFNTGNQRNAQRLGLGLVWGPEIGAVIQSQTGSQAHAFGTRAGDTLYEATSLPATFTVAGKPITPKTGAANLADGDLVVAYPLGDKGRKEVRFLDDRIELTVTHPGSFREQIPLLVLPGDSVAARDGSIEIVRDGGRLRIDHTGAKGAAVVEDQGKVGPYSVSAIHLDGADRLDYVIRLAFAAK